LCQVFSRMSFQHFGARAPSPLDCHLPPQRNPANSPVHYRPNLASRPGARFFGKAAGGDIESENAEIQEPAAPLIALCFPGSETLDVWGFNLEVVRPRKAS